MSSLKENLWFSQIPYLKKDLEKFRIGLEYLIEFYGFRKAIVLKL